MAETSTIFGFMKYVSATDILSDFKKTVDSHFVNSLKYHTHVYVWYFFYAFGFSQLSTKYETTKPPVMRVVSKNVIQNNHHSFYNEGVQAIKIRKNGDYNG